MLVLGTITLGGVTFWALRSEGVSVTVKMFRTFKELLGKRQQIYWLIIACT
jgi:nicotinic acid mononucleotide adenylyltransferase